MKIRTLGSLLVAFALIISSSTLPLAAGANEVKKGKVPDYSSTPRKDIPVEYTWGVEDIFPDEATWKKEKVRVTGLLDKIDKLSADWTASSSKMLAMFKLLEEIQKNGIKLYYYANLQSDMDMGNAKFQKMKGEMRNLFVQFGAKTSFRRSDLLKLGKEKFQRCLVEEPGLKPYAFGVEQVLRTRDHVLPQDQEKIISLSGLFSGSMSRAAGILNNVDVPKPEVTLSDGTKVTLNYANYVKYRGSKNRADRSLVIKSIWENQKKFENTFAVLFDGGMKQHLFNARVRNYKDCLEAALFGNNIDPAVYHNLIKATRANLGPLHRYFKLKQELLGLKTLKYEDMYASSVKSVDRVYTYDESETIILKMMKVLGKDYTEGLKLAFDNRWIDRYPNKNKQGGAYSSGVYGVHPFIKMNYDGTYNNVSTLAHELGHAMHSYFSQKTQPFATSGYASFLAEIASTFNENILMNYLLEHEKDDLFKLYILDAYFQNIKGTLYRQVQFAEFELAMHRRVEAGQTLTADWLNKKYLELTRFYYGHDEGVCEVGDYIESEWSSVPHFFLNYYVYTYSTGMICSTALAEMVLNGKAREKEKYLDFLKAGGSRYPLDTLKLAGVDITTDKPFQAAFKRFNRLLDEMEKIVKHLKKQNKI
jgi:oligoendopeptidase F